MFSLPCLWDTMLSKDVSKCTKGKCHVPFCMLLLLFQVCNWVTECIKIGICIYFASGGSRHIYHLLLVKHNTNWYFCNFNGHWYIWTQWFITETFLWPSEQFHQFRKIGMLQKTLACYWIHNLNSTVKTEEKVFLFTIAKGGYYGKGRWEHPCCASLPALQFWHESGLHPALCFLCPCSPYVKTKRFHFTTPWEEKWRTCQIPVEHCTRWHPCCQSPRILIFN